MSREPMRSAYVTGYSIGLDITIRGTEDRSFRKSPDSYTFVPANEASRFQSRFDRAVHWVATLSRLGHCCTLQ